MPKQAQVIKTFPSEIQGDYLVCDYIEDHYKCRYLHINAPREDQLIWRELHMLQDSFPAPILQPIDEVLKISKSRFAARSQGESVFSFQLSDPSVDTSHVVSHHEFDLSRGYVEYFEEKGIDGDTILLKEYEDFYWLNIKDHRVKYDWKVHRVAIQDDHVDVRVSTFKTDEDSTGAQRDFLNEYGTVVRDTLNRSDFSVDMADEKFFELLASDKLHSERWIRIENDQSRLPWVALLAGMGILIGAIFSLRNYYRDEE